jgi:hypothetical protein
VLPAIQERRQTAQGEARAIVVGAGANFELRSGRRRAFAVIELGEKIARRFENQIDLALGQKVNVGIFEKNELVARELRRQLRRNDREFAGLDEERIIEVKMTGMCQHISIARLRQAVSGQRRRGQARHQRRDASTRVGRFAARKILGILGAGDHTDDAGRLREPQGESQHSEPEHGIKDERQTEDHEQRAPVSQLIAHLTEPDRANDGPAHTVVFSLAGPENLCFGPANVECRMQNAKRDPFHSTFCTLPSAVI